MDIVRTIDPISEPVTLKEVKDYLRVEHSDEDNSLTLMIMASVAKLENYLNRSLITQTWQMSYSHYEPFFRLLHSPVKSIVDIQQQLSDNSIEIVPPSTYVLVDQYNAPKVTPSYNNQWSNKDLQIGNSIKITYTTGYGDTGDDIPQNIKQAILYMISDIYEDREMEQSISEDVKTIVAEYKVYTF